MAKIAERVVKARESKLNKKNHEELIQIVLRKDATERKLNSQIVSLKAEVNTLTLRIKGYDADMEGTEQTVEALKDKVKTLQEKNDALRIESNDNRNLYEEENKKVIALTKKAGIWLLTTYIMTIIAIVAIIGAVL